MIVDKSRVELFVANVSEGTQQSTKSIKGRNSADPGESIGFHESEVSILHEAPKILTDILKKKRDCARK